MQEIIDQNLSDEQVLKLHLKGNQIAFTILVQRHLDALFNFLVGYTHDLDLAEDLVQESFVKAWKNAKKFDSHYKFKTWLYTIAKNTALDFLKKKKTLPFSSFESEESIYETDASATLAVRQKQGQAQALLEMPLVQTAIQKLPEDYQQVLTLYYEQGFNFREIAELSKQSINTVKTRHRRAVLQLRKLLS